MDLSRRYLFFNLIKKPHEEYDSLGLSSTAYYLRVYDRFEEERWFLSWNWTCFFLAFFEFEPFWLFYRRMYGLGISMLFGRGICALLAYKAGILLYPSFGPLALKTMLWISRLIFTFGFTVMANALYMNSIRSLMKKEIKKNGTDPFSPIIFAMILGGLFFSSGLLKNPQFLELVRKFSGAE